VHVDKTEAGDEGREAKKVTARPSHRPRKERLKTNQVLLLPIPPRGKKRKFNKGFSRRKNERRTRGGTRGDKIRRSVLSDDEKSKGTCRKAWGAVVTSSEKKTKCRRSSGRVPPHTKTQKRGVRRNRGKKGY